MTHAATIQERLGIKPMTLKHALVRLDAELSVFSERGDEKAFDLMCASRNVVKALGEKMIEASDRVEASTVLVEALRVYQEIIEKIRPE